MKASTAGEHDSLHTNAAVPKIVENKGLHSVSSEVCGLIRELGRKVSGGIQGQNAWWAAVGEPPENDGIGTIIPEAEQFSAEKLS